MKQVIIVGDRLSLEERHLGTGPFSGPYSKWFKKELTRVGLSPLYINCWETERIGDFSQARKDAVLARIKSHNPPLVIVMGFEAMRLLGLLEFVTQDKDQHENIVNFFCPHEGLMFLPLFHPREAMTMDHWSYFIKAGLLRAADELNNPGRPLDDFPCNLHESVAEHINTINAIDASTESLCLDIETRYTKHKEAGKVVYVDNNLTSISYGSATYGTHVISRDQYGEDAFLAILDKLKPLIEDPKREKIGQNYFYDAWCLWYYHKIKHRGPVTDTLHLSNILRDFLPKSLNWIAKLYLRIKPWKGGHRFQGEDLRRYNAQDVSYTMYIAEKMIAEIHERGLYSYWNNYRRDLFESTFDMATYGLTVDLTKREALRAPAMEAIASLEARMNELCSGMIPPKETKKKVRAMDQDILVPSLSGKFEWVAASKKLGRVATTQKDFLAWLQSNGVSANVAKDYYYVRYDKPELGHKLGEVRKKAHATVMDVTARECFNPKSNPQKAAVLTNMGIKLEKMKKSADKDTTSSGAIRKTLAIQAAKLTEPQREFLLCLLEHAEQSKLITTYYNMLLDAGGKWYYSYNLEGAETGRSTSSKCPAGTGGNSQNLPRKKKGGANFKEVIIPSQGKVLGQLDQKSAESVIVAYLANCKAMITEFKKEDPDFHTLVASMLHPMVTDTDFNLLSKEDKKYARQGYKPVSHGGAYGLYEFMLQELIFSAAGMFLPIEECKNLLDSWHAAFPEIRNVWHAAVRKRLTEGTAWRNVFGREHRHGGVKSPNSLNEMLAWEPQSTVPELSNIMLKWCYEFGKTKPEWGLQVLQMGHDAVLVEIFPQHVAEFYDLFAARADQIKLTYPAGTVTIKWDAEFGPNWGNLLPIKDFLASANV